MGKWRLYRKKIMTIVGTLAAVGVLTVGVTGYGTQAQAAKEETQAKHLNIALQPVPGYVPLYLLKEEGRLTEALKEYNVNIKFTEFESGPPENESFAAKQQDIGVMGNVPAILGIANGQNRVFIGIAYNGEKTEATLVGKDSNITKLQDLKGKKVGLVVGSIAQNLLDAQLKSVGLQLSDVELVNLSPGEQSVALETHQVDAVSTWQPNIVKLQKATGAKILADGTGVFLGENPIVADADYVKNNPDIVKIFLEEYEKAAKEVQANPTEIANKYANTFGLSTDDFVSALQSTEFPVRISQADENDLAQTADFLYENKISTKKLDLHNHILYEVK